MPDRESRGGRSGVRFELRMALRYLASSRQDGPVRAVTTLCAAGVFVGVAALAIGLALMAGLQGAIKERLLANNPQVLVRPGWGRSAFSLDEVRRVERLVAEHPAVLASAPSSEEYGLMRSELLPGGRPVVLKRIDPAREDRVTGLAANTSASAWERLRPVDLSAPAEDAEDAVEDDDWEPLSDEELAPPEPPPVLLGIGVALQLGVTTGDVVHLISTRAALTPTLAAVPHSSALRVVGILDAGFHEYDQTLAVTSLESGPRARIDGIQLALRDPLESPGVARELAAALGTDVQVDDWTTTFARLFAAFRWEKLIMMAFLGLIGVVAGVNIFTILTMNVMARRQDVGVLSALGASAAAITRIFVWMGLVLGGAGTVAGLLAGSGAAWLLDRHEVVRLDPAVYLVSHVPFQVEPGDLVVVAAGMLAVSFLATLVPARRAAGVDPVVALRAG